MLLWCVGDLVKCCCGVWVILSSIVVVVCGRSCQVLLWCVGDLVKCCCGVWVILSSVVVVCG